MGIARFRNDLSHLAALLRAASSFFVDVCASGIPICSEKSDLRFIAGGARLAYEVSASSILTTFGSPAMPSSHPMAPSLAANHGTGGGIEGPG
jgi:hypothetical protein